MFRRSEAFIMTATHITNMTGQTISTSFSANCHPPEADVCLVTIRSWRGGCLCRDNVKRAQPLILRWLSSWYLTKWQCRLRRQRKSYLVRTVKFYVEWCSVINWLDNLSKYFNSHSEIFYLSCIRNMIIVLAPSVQLREFLCGHLKTARKRCSSLWH